MHPGFRLLLITCLASAACAPHAKYQQAWPAVAVTRAANPSTQNHVSVIEFDEQGDLWDTAQLKQALKMIGSTRKPLLVTFIHGWRHDARPDDDDLFQFTQFIDALNQVHPAGYTACGVFIGWRGASVEERFPPVTTLPALLSFWDRKQATGRMADIGLSRTLNQTAAAAWKNDGRAVAIGHSFGGRILEKTAGMSAASQAGALDTIKPVADLVVLINPASESLTARKLKLALRNWNKRYPLMVALGATNDGATGKAWPLGYKLSPQPRTRSYHTLGRPDPQARYLDVTVTNDQRQITHELNERPVADDISTPGANTFARNLAALASTTHQPIWIRTGPDDQATAFFLDERDTRRVDGVEFVLESKAYWTLQVPPKVLSGHNGDRRHGGVLSTAMTDLIAGIFARAELARRDDGGPKVAPTTSPLAPTPTGATGPP